MNIMDNKNKFLIMNNNGVIWREIMLQISNFMFIGMSVKNIDIEVGKLLDKYGAESAPIKLYSFPGYSCISVNDCACHGVPNDYILRHGDIVTLDLSFCCNNYYVDGARNYLIIDFNKFTKLDAENLSAIGFVKYVVDQAVHAANIELKNGNQISFNFFGKVMHMLITKSQYNLCAHYCGHSIGESLHLDPLVPNCNLGEKEEIYIKEYDAFCIEPIISFKSGKELFMKLKNDGWNVYNVEGEPCFHYENTYMMINNKIISIT